MAINKIIYGGNTLIDLSGDTVTAADLASGVTAHDRTGTQITGTGGGGGGAIVVVDETLPNGSTAKHITGVDISDTTAVASDVASGKVFYTADGTQTTGTASSVTVESLSVTQNGTYTAPTGKAYSPVTVNVSGGGGEAEEKDVNFYDYDGTRVYSYTKADFLALNAMPSNPDHSGDNIPLTSQGWNWSLADAKTYVTTYDQLDIGQIYRPTDNKTHIVIEIPENTPSGLLTYYVRYTQTVSQGVTVDWGDGNFETFTGTSAANRSHTYAAPGMYDITLSVTDGSVSFIGSTTMASYGSQSNYQNRSRVKKVYFGNNVTTVGNYFFRYCYELQTVTLSPGITDIGSYVFEECYDLRSVTIPTNVTTFGGYAFTLCRSLRSVVIPASVTTIGIYAFNSCYSLQKVTLPPNFTSISNSLFYVCYGLRSITIPADVASIDTYAFYNNYSVLYIRAHPTTPPTVGNAQAFNGIPSSVPIIVPDDSVSAYKAASIWSNYASRIIGESDWDPA